MDKHSNNAHGNVMSVMCRISEPTKVSSIHRTECIPPNIKPRYLDSKNAGFLQCVAFQIWLSISMLKKLRGFTPNCLSFASFPTWVPKGLDWDFLVRGFTVSIGSTPT